MICIDENALICDLAETYGIYDYESLPVSRVATFAVWLPESSRIKMKIAGAHAKTETILLAGIYDKLSWLVWAQTEDGRNNRNRPVMIAPKMLGQTEDTSRNFEVYSSGEEFEKARNKIIGKE